MERAELFRAESLLGLGRYDEAERSARGVLAQQPDSAAALRVLAQALTGLKRDQEALHPAYRAVALEPEDEQNLRVLSSAYLALGQGPEALWAADAAVRLAPWLWQTHYSRSQALRITHPPRSVEALAAANEAIRIAPHVSESHNLAGLCLADLDRRKQARSAYEEALRLDPHSALAMNNLAAGEVNRGRLRSASRLLSTGLDTDPHQPVLQHNYDVILFGLVRRLSIALIALGVLLFVLVIGRVPYAARAGTTLTLLATYASLTWWVTRDLPRGTHRWARGLIARSSPAQVFLLLVFSLLSLNVTAIGFAPQSLAPAISGGVFAIVRVLGLGLVALVIVPRGRRKKT